MSSSVCSRIDDASSPAVLDRDSVGDRESRLAEDPHDLDAGTLRSKRDRDSRREPPAADRDQHGLGLGNLLGELEPDRSLPGDDTRLLERVHQRGARALDVSLSGGDRLLEALPDELGRTAVGTRRLDLRHRCVLRHEDRRVDSRFAGRPGNGLAVIARARCDDARLSLFRAERRDRVVRAADLEGPGALEVLRLEKHLPAGQARERLAGIERASPARRRAAALARPRRQEVRERPSSGSMWNTLLMISSTAVNGSSSRRCTASRRRSSSGSLCTDSSR